MTNPTGIVTNYVYDTLNRLAGITDSSDVYISSYTYDSLNRRVEKKLPNIAAPLTTSYTYDLASQLKSITNMPVNISNYYDNYDNVGNRLNMTDSAGTHNYTYDNLYRLTDSSNPSENYSYDPVGNRNPITQTYDAGNRLLENDTYTYTYDLDGNMTSKVKKVGGETTTYTYNSEDQLIGVVTPAQTVSYKYDALGRRIQKKIVDGSSEIVVKYVYDGEDIIQELDGNNALITSYTHGPGIDEPILLEKNGQKYYYITDGLNSVTALVNSDGNVVQTYRYNSFGNIIDSTGTVNQPYTYTGREYDPETGLFYYRRRYYDPNIGRFLQEDPVWNDNLYSYVENNPLNLVDPYGLIGIPRTKYWVDTGEEAGERAGEYWANKLIRSDNILSTVGSGTMLFFSSLWTCDTSTLTIGTLLAGAAVAPWAARTGPWLGSIAYHAAHGLAHGGKAHIQIMIRVGLHLTKHWRILLPW